MVFLIERVSSQPFDLLFVGVYLERFAQGVLQAAFCAREELHCTMDDPREVEGHVPLPTLVTPR